MSTTTAIHVTVTFPLGKEGSYKASLPPTTTVGFVLSEAMNHFHAQPEPNVVYYLSSHGERQDPSKTVDQVAREAEAVSFRLVKEITQG